MHRALSQSELLELILLSLDLQTLLTSAQRVCSQWRHIIRESPFLQGTLFFKPRRTSLSHPSPGDQEHHQSAPNHRLPRNLPQLQHPRPRPNLPSVQMHSLSAPRGQLALHAPPAAATSLRHPATLTPKTSYPLHKEGLRMETLFELLFFDHDLTEVNYPHRLVWWGQCSETAFCDGLKSFGRIELPDVLVCACRSHTCTDMDSDFENEDQDVVDAVHAEYRELGLKPKVLGPERKRTKLEYSGAWD
ncbi:uncharacterized protein BDW43DRAFT_315352 [Aspergillus alliaceus]|uniref:uncharacterized protein n=1 Tax=Petromyces alliaceus TaxID=209559 RepID=UPI0012A6E13C|nr:uncharacterized protein BDW43DRAFT_315352 [Aspergillus alliaceus]KAB8229016.1 hypothetical protein BDW43DRAFT_315352 [Aspergillus alliaceus]